jgi:uncharacterized circularly permuted ATP-grasp superfamily protein
VLNGLYRAEVLYSKALFAVLSDPAHAHRLEPEIAEAAARHVPWTRVVRAGTSTWEGREVDLPSFLIERQESLVLKPARGFGGEGVRLGWQCPPEEWRAAVRDAMGGSAITVAQERVRLRTEPYPVRRGGALEIEERFADLNPFVWGDEVASGCVARVGREPMLNLARGASFVPVFVLGASGC